jgi:2-dehydro-3-deoxyphosphooctonate aldolase (KDO 8-P synthase)
MLPNIPKLKNTDSGNFFLIAGPCVVETEQITFDVARAVQQIADKFKIPFIFKASYRKANRTSLKSFTGIGDEKGLQILKKISTDLHIPVLTDIHESAEAGHASEYVDVLQIPAFLCRQTDLLVAAAKTGKFVNVKKGQFLSAESMSFAVNKIRESGNENIMLTERGTTFGYQDLVVDFRGIQVMQKNKVPVILDVTHSLQQPNQPGGITGGQPEMISAIAKAGIAVGVDGLFIETHPDPSQALSDGANMLKLDKLENLLVDLVRIRKATLNLKP